MDPEQFRIWGKAMVDQVADYWSTIRDRKPLPNVAPGFMQKLIPPQPPQNGENWQDILSDVEPCVLQTNTHWAHPHFFGYFPSAISYPSIMGDILCGGLGSIGFSWLGSPASTEMELIVLDWVAQMLKLPPWFMNSDPGPGIGMIQSTTSECALVVLLSAKARAMQNCQYEEETAVHGAKFVAYCSEQVHSSVERAALLASVEMRSLPTNHEFALTGSIFEKAIQKDIANGFLPIFLCATVGTTPSCAVDNLKELGPICQKYGIWMHVDAAYGGSACICPEYRHLLDGVEFADTLCVNAHKLMAVTFDCAMFWMRDGRDVKHAFLVDPVYLQHPHKHEKMDLRHYQIPLGRRFRALKLWFTLRSFGVTGLQEHVRKPCRLAKEFEALVQSDKRFEIAAPVRLGLVCFRLHRSNKATRELLALLNEDRRIFLVPSTVRDKFVLRLAIGPTSTTSADIYYVWNVIRQMADCVMREV